VLCVAGALRVSPAIDFRRPVAMRDAMLPPRADGVSSAFAAAIGCRADDALRQLAARALCRPPSPSRLPAMLCLSTRSEECLRFISEAISLFRHAS